MATPAEETAFPRGGKQVLTPLERKRLREEAKHEAERDFAASGPRKKNRSSALAEGAEEDLAFAREAARERLPKFVELLKFKNLNVGAKVWGCIASISSKELTVSLPDGLRGVVPLAEASDVLSELVEKAGRDSKEAPHTGKSPAGPLPSLQALFRVGQFVRASVHKLEEGTASTKGGSKRRVILSLKVAKQNADISRDSLAESMCLPACVRSAEDHGYTLMLGIKGASAFLSTEQAGGAPLLPGMLLDVIVVKAKDRRMLQVAAGSAITGRLTKEWPGLSIGSLLPGMLVTVKVRNILSDGLLVSFLTYFTGTIDPFHLSAEGAVGEQWKQSFSEGQRLKARVLYVDTESKRICLSVLPHLLKMTSPQLPGVGTLVQEAVVQRVDPAVGVLLELAAGGSGYAHISDVSDEKVDKLERVLKPGQKEAARVIGARLMDGLAVLSLKPSAVEQFLADGVEPGDVVKGSVVLVDEGGVLVNIARNLNAFVPNDHVSDLGAQSKAKFKVGRKVAGRVLTVDPLRKRMTMTLKKVLLESKLPPLAAWEDAKAGMRVHGTVHGMTDAGVFVHFYGGVKGFAHISELGLQPGQKPASAFTVGQVVKARVLDSDIALRRIRLSLASKKKSAAAEAGADVQPGFVAQGVVRETVEGPDGTTTAYVVDLVHQGLVVTRGHLEVEHLADHPAAVAALAECIQPGANVGTVLVLERLAAAETWRLTRKQLLVAAAASLPRTTEDLADGQVYPGYVANVVPQGVFVRFLDKLTGRAGLPQLADKFVSDAGLEFQKGQSVRAHVSNVNAEKGHFTVTLKQSVTGNVSAGYVASLFEDLEAAAAIKAAREQASGEAPSDWSKFEVGSLVKGAVHGLKPYGTLVDLEDDPDLVGLIPPHQARPGGAYKVGQPLVARVLDVVKKDGVVELGHTPALLESSEAQLPEVGSPVEAQVQLVRSDYAAVSLPAYGHAIAFVGTADYNAHRSDVQRRFPNGSRHKMIVAAAPAPGSGRLVLQAMRQDVQSTSSKLRLPALAAGSLVTGTVSRLQPLQATVDLPDGRLGRIHVTEVTDEEAAGANPLAALKAGQQVTAAVMGSRRHKGRQIENWVELSIRPSVLAAAEAGEAPERSRDPLATLSPGTELTGYVAKVAPDCLWLAVSSKLSGRVSALDAGTDPAELASLCKLYRLGDPARARVLKADAGRQTLDLSLVLQPKKGLRPSTEALEASAGDSLLGRIIRLHGSGVKIQLGPGVVGTASLLDLHDAWVEDAFQGLRRGMFVRCCVIEGVGAAADGSGKARPAKRRRKEAEAEADDDDAAATEMRVSLKASSGALVPGRSKPGRAKPLEPQELSLGATVKGYIKSVGKQGAFVTVAPGVDARVKLSKLADTFLDNPQEAFPVGKLVSGRIVGNAHGRLEMSLRGDQRRDNGEQLERLREGQTVRGQVTRVEDYGAFVRLSDVEAIGLVHKSELADAYVKTVASQIKPGQGVRAKVLAVDLERGRLSLGMKKSYFLGEPEDAADTPASADEASESDLDEELAAGLQEEGGSPSESEAEEDEENSDQGLEEEGDLDEALLDLPAGKRQRTAHEASSEEGVEVSEEEQSSSDAGSGLEGQPDALLGGVGWGGEEEQSKVQSSKPAAEAAAAAKSESAAKRRLKREKQEHEAAIRAAEKARLQGSAPDSAADYERELLGQPSSSYLWIRYMAFLVNLGEVAKARAVAERALQTINYRAEGEKFNVWVAWLNLEMKYGEPADEAVMQLFQRALAFANQKKLYLALIGILERAGQDVLLAQTFKAVARKFPGSAKMWLRQLAYLQSRSDVEGAARLLERAMDATPARKHVKILRQAALQEFRGGTPERGRSIFEQLLREYPKRLDLWSVYLDQEIKQGEQARIRALFERATAVIMPVKKIKFLFKRYLEYEQQHGTPATVDAVKQAAREYLARLGI